MYENWLKKTLIVLEAIFSIWLLGFILFLVKIYFTPISQDPADAIVILTGGKGRIQAGLQLLQKSPDSTVLISGAHKQTHLDEIAPYSDYHDKITLGYEANSTRENAKETKEWAKEFEKLSSLKVVTSHYHIPRSLLELEKALPNVRLIPYPVISSTFRSRFWWLNPYNIKILFLEYNKYLVVWIESKFL